MLCENKKILCLTNNNDDLLVSINSKTLKISFLLFSSIKKSNWNPYFVLSICLNNDESRIILSKFVTVNNILI